MNSDTAKDTHSWAKVAFILCLSMIPVLVWTQNTTTTKKQAKPASVAPAKSSPPPPAAQPRNVPPPRPQNPPTQPKPISDQWKHQVPTPVAPRPQPKPFNPPIDAKRFQRPDGSATIEHRDGRKWEVNGAGQVTRFSKPGMQAQFGRDGRLTSIRDDRRGVTITRAPNGVRQVVSVRPDGTRVVSYGMNRGYVERRLSRAGYIQRTYVIGGRRYVSVYRTYNYNGIVYQRYVPAVYYRPRFYAWAATPWSAPVPYAWGWNAEPWYGYYPGYLTPAPAYPNAAYWLTDFLLAANLQLAYENQQPSADAGSQPDAESTPLSPGIKLAIAREVGLQITAEQAAAAQSASQPAVVGGQPPVAPPPALDPAQKVFVVSSNLDLLTTTGTSCPLTPGDIIIRTDDRIGDGNVVSVTVLSAKAGDCPLNSTTSVEVAALQEMHNDFRQQIDSGLSTLANNQAGGLPSPPPAGAFNSRDGQGQSDLNSEASLIQQQQQSANQSELEVRVGSNGAGQ